MLEYRFAERCFSRARTPVTLKATSTSLEKPQPELVPLQQRVLSIKIQLEELRNALSNKSWLEYASKTYMQWEIGVIKRRCTFRLAEQSDFIQVSWLEPFEVEKRDVVVQNSNVCILYESLAQHLHGTGNGCQQEQTVHFVILYTLMSRHMVMLTRHIF